MSNRDNQKDAGISIRKLDVLKDLYSFSDKTIIIADYKMNILWTNDNSYFCELSNCEGIFKINPDKPSESGSYFVKINGLCFIYTLINYPNLLNGIYVIELDKKDALFVFLENPQLFCFIEKKIGIIREAIFEIITSNSIINSSLEENFLYDEQKFLNLNVNSCFKMLRSVMNISELIKYTELKKNEIYIMRINISSNVNSFAHACRNILRSSEIIVKTDVQPDLFAQTDLARFISLMIALLMLMRRQIPENDVIIYKAYKSGKNIILNVVSESLGSIENDSDEPKIQVSEYSKDCDDDNDVDSEIRIIKCYCDTFKASFLSSDTKKYGPSYTVRMDAADETNMPINLKSPSYDALSNRFSKFHVALSEFIKYKFY